MTEAFWTALIVAAVTGVLSNVFGPMVSAMYQRRKTKADTANVYADTSVKGAKTIGDLLDDMSKMRVEHAADMVAMSARVDGQDKTIAELNASIANKNERITQLEKREARIERVVKSWASDVITAWNVVTGQLREAGMTPQADIPPLPNFDD